MTHLNSLLMRGPALLERPLMNCQGLLQGLLMAEQGLLEGLVMPSLGLLHVSLQLCRPLSVSCQVRHTL